MADELAEAKAATAAVHTPGPGRMVGRQLVARDCLGCGRRWPCEHSWQARAEKAEANLAAVRELLRGEHGSWIRMAGIWDVIGDDEGGGDD